MISPDRVEEIEGVTVSIDLEAGIHAGGRKTEFSRGRRHGSGSPAGRTGRGYR